MKRGVCSAIIKMLNLGWYKYLKYDEVSSCNLFFFPVDTIWL
jgi:hypothetical protein